MANQHLAFASTLLALAGQVDTFTASPFDTASVLAQARRAAAFAASPFDTASVLAQASRAAAFAASSFDTASVLAFEAASNCNTFTGLVGKLGYPMDNPLLH